MEAITIQIAKDKYKSAKEARRDGQIPITYYSKDIETVHFTTEYQDFRRAYNKAGRSTIITMIDEKNEEYPALVHEIQYHPVTDDIIHIDLMAIKKGQKITAEIPIVFVGDAPAVRELAGTFMSNKDKITIECLPKDLPHEIEVDISGLVDFNISLNVDDIKVPNYIHIVDAGNISIATVSAPRGEEAEEVKKENNETEATEGDKNEDSKEDKSE